MTGVTDIIAAIRLRKIIRNEWLLGLSGVASVLFGAIVLLFPTGAGALALAAFIAIYALLTGTMLVVLSLRLRAWPRGHTGKGDDGNAASTRF